MALKVSTLLRDKLTGSTWIGDPGVVSGCGVRIHDRVWINILSGRLSFPNSRSATIKHEIINACKIPVEPGIYYVEAVVGPAGVTFNCRKGTLSVTKPNGSLLKGQPDMVPLARIRWDGKMAQVFEHVDTTEDHLVGFRNVFPAPDGDTSKFFLAETVYANQALDLRVAGVAQVEGEDYVIRPEVGPDGKYISIIEFLNEVPAAGTDITARIYLGRVGVTR